MNTDRILKLADLIEAGDDKLGFNMETYGQPSSKGFPDLSSRNCGTVACIAGWAVAAFGRSGKGRKVQAFRVVRANRTDEPFNLGGKLLGLDCYNAHELFSPGSVSDWDQITPPVAARCLRNLAETGEVDWEKAMETSNDQAS